MSTSGKQMVINTRERAVSSDINRLQAFHSADLAETLRLMVLSLTQASYGGGSLYLEATQTSPLTALILGGLLVEPEIGGTSLLVTPGAMYAIDPTGDTPDDSPAKFVNDPGVTGTGVLTFLANAGPAIRVDVVECSLVNTVIEVVKRDVFDPSNGLFTPTAVDKVRAFRLQYRVRRGVAGGGYPGSAAGWLPLMVAAVPASATNWDGCRCYDVRPLLVDRRSGLVAERNLHSQQVKQAHIVATEEAVTLNGFFHGTIEREWNEWRAGGFLPAGGVRIIDLFPAGFDYDSGLGQMGMVYAMFPHGLPRWCEYKDASTGERAPGPFRGILTIATRQPLGNGAPSAGIALPASTGLTGTHSSGCLMWAFYRFIIGNHRAPSGFAVAGHVTKVGMWANMSMTPVYNGGSDSYDANFTLKPDDIQFVGGLSSYKGLFPANAKVIRGLIGYDISYTGAIAASQLVRAQSPGGFISQRALLTSTGAGSAYLEHRFELVLPQHYPTEGFGVGGMAFQASFLRLGVSGLSCTKINFSVDEWEA